MSYQTNIENQFNFMQQPWANNLNFPLEGDGEDPIAGQKDYVDQKHSFKLSE